MCCSEEMMNRALTVAVTAVALTSPSAIVRADGPRAAVEFRAARGEPAEGFTRMRIAGTGQSVYVRDAPGWRLTRDDVTEARIDKDERGRPAVTLKFSPAASERMGKLSESLLNRQLAILVDGALTSAPVVRSKITSAALISGDLTDDQVQRIVASFRRD
jgi:preprotein translocase subunit SecD